MTIEATRAQVAAQCRAVEHLAKAVAEVHAAHAAILESGPSLRGGTLSLTEFCDLYGLPEPGAKPFLDNPDVDSTHWDDSGRGCTRLPIPPDPAQEPPVERGSSWDFDIYHRRWVRTPVPADPAQEPPVELTEQAPNDEIILRAALEAWFKAGGERCPEQAMRAALEAAR